jgi:peptide subunit release factor RF-3
VDINLQHLPYKIARWVKEPVPKIGNFLVEDEEGNKVVLFENEFSLDWVKKQNPSLHLYSMEDRPLK